MAELQSTCADCLEGFEDAADRDLGICLWLPRQMHRLSSGINAVALRAFPLFVGVGPMGADRADRVL